MFAVIVKKSFGGRDDGYYGHTKGISLDVFQEFDNEEELREWVKANSNTQKFRVIRFDELQVETKISFK